jgi:hypothetical protein
MQPNAHIVETLAANGTTEETRTTPHELNEINGKEGCNHALYIGLCAAIACNHLHTAMSLILSGDENMLSEATAHAVRIAPGDMFYRISLGTLESDHVDQFPHLIHVAGLNCIPSRARWLASRWEGDVDVFDQPLLQGLHQSAHQECADCAIDGFMHTGLGSDVLTEHLFEMSSVGGEQLVALALLCNELQLSHEGVAPGAAELGNLEVLRALAEHRQLGLHALSDARTTAMREGNGQCAALLADHQALLQQ